MQNYEYILIDSSKRSNGNACDFSYELNRPVRDIKKLELVYSSLSNTILTFTDRDYFYFQEEGEPYTPNGYNRLYIQENSINVIQHNIFYKEKIEIPISNDQVFKFYETDGGTTHEYAFLITQSEFDLPIADFVFLLLHKINEQGCFNTYALRYINNKVTIMIAPDFEYVHQFGLDFSVDEAIYLKLGFQKKRYSYNTTFTSTETLVKNEISNRQITIPTGIYNFDSFITTLQEKLNDVVDSDFIYNVNLIDGFVSIDIIQDDDERFARKFQLPSGTSLEYIGFILAFPSAFDKKHVANSELKGVIHEIEIYETPYYYPNELILEIQSSLDIINRTYKGNYQIDILDSKLIITNNITPFIVIIKTNSILFNFINNEFLNSHTSLSSTIFQNNMNSIQFENGSYTSDDILEFLKLKLNSDGRSGYDAQISLSNFKINISNETKKFMIFFSKDDSVYKRFGFQQKDTLYLNEHISDYTASLESSDYILVQIRGVSTVITNKKTSGCFFIPIISSRYEVQTINENQSFNQCIYTGNLDLSTLDIKLLNDEGDILESEELNLKMLIKCYK